MQTVIGKWTDDAAQPEQGGSSSGFWENALGTVGATAGHIEGIPGALLSFGTDNPITAGAVGGGIGGTFGAGIDDLVSGKGLNWGHITKGGLTQGAYGAIPGGDEVKAIPLLGRLASNAVGRTALRAGVGAAGNSAAQFVQKGQVDPSQSLTAGAINAVLPGFGKIGNSATSGLPASIQKRIAQSHFGLTAAENPIVAALADHNPIKSFANVKQAASKTAADVRLYLDQKTGNIDDFMNHLVTAGKNVPPAARGGINPDLAEPIYRQWLEHVRDQVAQELEANGGKPINFTTVKDIPLSFMNDIKAAVGKHYDTDPVAKEMWSGAKRYILDQYGEMPPALQQLWKNQESLIHASNTARKLEDVRGVPSLGGHQGAVEGMAGPLVAAASILGRVPVLGAGIGGAGVLTQQMKNPQVANAVGKLLQRSGQRASKMGLPQALQQLGVRF